MRKVVAITAAISAFAVACEIISGLDSNRFTTAPADAASEGGPTEDAPSSVDLLCTKGGPVEKPTATDKGGALSFIVAFSDFDIAGVDGGAEGYNLDRRCSCDPELQNGDGNKSCLLPSTQVTPNGCDLDGGIDNSLRAAAEAAPNGTLLFATEREAFKCGDSTILLLVRDYTGEADDREVHVTAIPSYGLQFVRNSDAGSDPACRHMKPSFTSNDIWKIESGFVSTNPDSGVPDPNPNPGLNFRSGYVKNFRFVVDLRNDDYKLPFVFASQRLQVATPVISGDLVPVREDNSEIPIENGAITDLAAVRGFKVKNGLVTGRVAAESVNTVVGNALIGGAPLCQLGGGETYNGIRDSICAARDIRTAAGDDGLGFPCDGLSLAFYFEAAPASIGTQSDPLDVGDASCATSCPP